MVTVLSMLDSKQVDVKGSIAFENPYGFLPGKYFGYLPFEVRGMTCHYALPDVCLSRQDSVEGVCVGLYHKNGIVHERKSLTPLIMQLVFP